MSVFVTISNVDEAVMLGAGYSTVSRGIALENAAKVLKHNKSFAIDLENDDLKTVLRSGLKKIGFLDQEHEEIMKKISLYLRPLLQRNKMSQELFDRLQTVCETHLSKTSIYDSVLACVEEAGELAQAIRVEEGLCKKEVKESSIVEAVDLILCAYEVFVGRGGDFQQFVRIANHKLDKFEANQK